MKAKLLTGEIVDVEFFEQRGTAMTNVYIEKGVGRTFYEYELEFINETDEPVIVHHIYNQVDEEKHWQDVRERAAIATMQSIINSDTFRRAAVESAVNLGELPYKTIAESAIKFADALVKQLKEE